MNTDDFHAVSKFLELLTSATADTSVTVQGAMHVCDLSFDVEWDEDNAQYEATV